MKFTHKNLRCLSSPNFNERLFLLILKKVFIHPWSLIKFRTPQKFSVALSRILRSALERLEERREMSSSSDKRTVFTCMRSHQQGVCLEINFQKTSSGEWNEDLPKVHKFHSSPVTKYLRCRAEFPQTKQNIIPYFKHTKSFRSTESSESNNSVSTSWKRPREKYRIQGK